MYRDRCRRTLNGDDTTYVIMRGAYFVEWLSYQRWITWPFYGIAADNFGRRRFFERLPPSIAKEHRPRVNRRRQRRRRWEMREIGAESRVMSLAMHSPYSTETCVSGAYEWCHTLSILIMIAINKRTYYSIGEAIEATASNWAHATAPIDALFTASRQLTYHTVLCYRIILSQGYQDNVV